MSHLALDLRHALRALRARPGASLAIVALLALGIGASVAVFTLVHAILLSPLPYPEPERLVRLYQAYPERGLDDGAAARPDIDDWATRAETVTAMGAYSTLPSGPVLGGDEPYQVPTAYVSAGFFEALGRAPLLGRWPRPEEEAADAAVVVLSHGFWQRRFGGDPDLVGDVVVLDHEPHTVVGVMPADFAFPSADVEAWAFMSRIPQQSIPWELRFVRWLGVVARLAPGVDAAAAEEELTAIAAALAEEHPESNAGAGAVTVEPLADVVVGDVRPALASSWGAVELVLLVACANVAHLLLAGGLARRRELAVRGALGAGRGRLVRQLLFESLLLGAGGATLGLGLAAWAVELVVRWGGDVLPRTAEVAIDGTVVAFAAASAIATALLFGVMPAVTASRVDLARDLGAEGRSAVGGGRAHPRLRRALVVAEVALAAMLAIGAGLLGRSFLRMLAVDPGLDAERLLMLTLTVPDANEAERAGYLAVHRELGERLAALPGVAAVASGRNLPVGAEGERFEVTVAGRPAPPPGEAPFAQLHQVTPGYFRALGTPLLAGRDLAPRDDADAPLVVLVNETAARRFFAGDAVGRRLVAGETTAEVVGVVGDLKHDGLAAEAPPAIYIPLAQSPRRVFSFAIRTAGDPASLASAVRAVVHDVDPRQPIAGLATMPDLLGEAVGRPRFFTLLVGVFAALALVLAGSGAYAVVAVLARERTREIGVRLALGAERSDILRLLLGDSARSLVTGLVLGLAGGLLVGRWLESQLFEVAAHDVTTFVAVAVVLLAAGLLAAWLPARRAARLDPLAALR